MEIGRTFVIDGVSYAIKKISGDRVDASKFKDGALQRGRPCKFTYKQVAEALGESVVETEVAVASNETAIEEWRETRSDPAKLQALIESFGDDTSDSNDW